MIRFKFVLLLFLLSVVSGYSQITKMAEEFIGMTTKIAEETTPPAEIKDSAKIKDSLKIIELTQQIQQMKLSEIFSQGKTAGREYSPKYDSLELVHRKMRIDSLRAVTPGAPVVIDEDTLFTLYASRGENSSVIRANNTKSMINLLGEKRGIDPDSISLFTLDGYTQIMYEDRVILIVTEEDALWMDTNITSLSQLYKTKIVDEIKYLQDKNSLINRAKRIGELVLALVLLCVVFYGLNFLYKKAKVLIKQYSRTKFKSLTIRNYDILKAPQKARILIFLVNILRYILILIVLIITIPILFSIFPQTKNLAETLFGYIFIPVRSIFYSIIYYIPNLFTIIIIWLCIHYVIKGLKYISKEIGSGQLKIPGFYADWAIPTFNLLRFFLVAFMIAMIYPYLPGANSGIFQGISVFVGLIVSLGSTAVIGNIVAGLVITYMRSFKIGDMIQLNDTMGSVIEKTPFVTRIRTHKNEIITIPNSFMMSTQIINYTSSADNYGLIIHTTVGISYDIPNQKVHELLIKAAKMTKRVLSDREPYVLDLKFENLTQEYEINAYITNVDAIKEIYSELHGNIQQAFNEAGINLQTPFVVLQKKDIQ